jgi:hypothetical protein
MQSLQWARPWLASDSEPHWRVRHGLVLRPGRRHWQLEPRKTPPRVAGPGSEAGPKWAVAGGGVGRSLPVGDYEPEGHMWGVPVGRLRGPAGPAGILKGRSESGLTLTRSLGEVSLPSGCSKRQPTGSARRPGPWPPGSLGGFKFSLNFKLGCLSAAGVQTGSEATSVQSESGQPPVLN